jgi:FKBP-type peptidyl-prolyl cis-trans isomerase (trigger factor)
VKAAWEKYADRRIATLSEEGLSPEAIYVEVRQGLASRITDHMKRDLETAEILTYQGITADTLNAHMRATIDAGDAVTAGLHAKVFPQNEAEVQPERVDPRLARMAEMREQGVPDGVIATQMRAELMQGSSAAAQGRLARFTACVTGRGASHEAEAR